MLRNGVFASVLGITLTACGGPNLRLRQVVLYQNGIGYFERSGESSGGVLRLKLREHEVDDVMKTLTVIGATGGSSLSAVVPEPVAPVRPDRDDEADEDAPEPDPEEVTNLEVRLGGGGNLTVSYAVPTPSWQAVYRIVLPDDQAAGEALLQAWAVVHNASGEDWEDVQLTLATGAPFTYAIDLRSPRFVARPDLTGEMVRPVLYGSVRSSQSRPGDIGGADSDQDRILDADDQCPNDPETYNGVEDEDGCPDRGSVVVEENNLVILEKVYFAAQASSIQARSRPILEAVAATLNGNPQIQSVSIEGHAARNEPNAWALSEARARAVRDALLGYGVARSRLTTRPLGHTRPADPRGGASAHERNRRVEFQIGPGARPDSAPPPPTRSLRNEPASLAADAPAAAPAPVSVEAVQSTTTSLAVPADSTDGTRYVLTETVTIPEASSTLVAIINRRVSGRELLLFRPDSSTPASRTHPFRAARIENPTDMRLVDGPVAIFARGTFVGDGVLDTVHPGENTVIPFSLDGSTTVLVRRDADRRPSRLVSIARGVMTVQDWDVRRTHYEIRVGERAPAELVVHHQGRAGYEIVDLPPNSEESGQATMIPVPIDAGRTSELVVEERRETRRSIRIAQERRLELAGYFDPEDLPEDIRTRLQEAIRLREALDEAETRLRDVREQAATANQRLTQLQASLTSIERSRSAGELRRQLEARLAAANRQAEQFNNQIAALTAERAEARVRLTEVLADLTYGEVEDN